MAATYPASLLLVEDDTTARTVLARIIETTYHGCTVYTADNGREGLELFRRFNPPMVITDVNMPVMDGIDMAREIRSLNASTSLIVVSAYGDEHFHQSYSEIGFCGFVAKPVDFNQLFSSIERCTVQPR